MSRLKKYGYLWVTLALFLSSLIGHWILAWTAYANEARAHGDVANVRDYAIEAGRDTLENWQSEFLQLIWQVAGLSFLLFVGSPDSREQDERLEAKIDFLLAHTRGGEDQRKFLDRKFPRR
ncbi:hypothetical protein PHYC_00476 [Phycisphaerales bacterium]|nr:hypothetical protein PHYC_00476 [Phycisphaerales bacterium]